MTAIYARVYVERTKMLVNAVNRGEVHQRRPSRIVHLRTFAVNFLLSFWVHGESEKNDRSVH